jgi:hypothetical protein
MTDTSIDNSNVKPGAPSRASLSRRAKAVAIEPEIRQMRLEAADELRSIGLVVA